MSTKLAKEQRSKQQQVKKQNGKTLVKISKHRNQNKNESKKEAKARQEDKFVPEM